MGAKRGFKMKSLKVELQIDLNEEVVESDLSEGLTPNEILQSVESHIRNALGNRHIDGWHYIDGLSITTAEVS